MKKKILLILAVCFLLSSSSVFAIDNERWAYEYVSGIEGVDSPLFGSNKNLMVTSSWNEPRVGETHKGVDQGAGNGTEVGPMWGTARVLDNSTITGGGMTQTIRYYNSATGKTYYSIYMHLSAYLFSENQVAYLSDSTAKTGNSGTGSTCISQNKCYHLHYELIDSVPVSQNGDGTWNVTHDSRVGVNVRTHMTTLSASGLTTTTWNGLSVFSGATVSGRRLTIRGIDSDVGGNNQLNEAKIYYKTDGSAYYGVANMTKSGTEYWYYDFPSSASYVDYFIVGRRSSTERWSAYPVKRYNMGTDPSPNTCGCTYDTVRINF